MLAAREPTKLERLPNASGSWLTSPAACSEIKPNACCKASPAVKEPSVRPTRRSVTSCTAGIRASSMAWPWVAENCRQASFRLPWTLDQLSASREAWPMAPESSWASTTIWSKACCFWISVRSLNSLPNISMAWAFRVVSVAETPRAASFS